MRLTAGTFIAVVQLRSRCFDKVIRREKILYDRFFHGFSRRLIFTPQNANRLYLQGGDGGARARKGFLSAPLVGCFHKTRFGSNRIARNLIAEFLYKTVNGLSGQKTNTHTTVSFYIFKTFFIIARLERFARLFRTAFARVLRRFFPISPSPPPHQTCVAMLSCAHSVATNSRAQVFDGRPLPQSRFRRSGRVLFKVVLPNNALTSSLAIRRNVTRVSVQLVCLRDFSTTAVRETATREIRIVQNFIFRYTTRATEGGGDSRSGNTIVV